MNSNLISTVMTTEDRDILHEEIEILQKSLFAQKQNSFESALKNRVRKKISQVIQIEIKDEADAASYLNRLKGDVEALDTVKLAIAFEPTEAVVARIHEKITSIVGNYIIIDLTVSKGIVGGAIIIYKGKFIDLSIKEVYEAEMRDIRDEIVKILDSPKYFK